MGFGVIEGLRVYLNLFWWSVWMCCMLCYSSEVYLLLEILTIATTVQSNSCIYFVQANTVCPFVQADLCA